MVAIFVVATILLFVGIELIRERAAKRKPAPEAGRARIPAADRFLIPRGYFLGNGHAWAELLFDGKARVGMDDFLRKLVGNVDAITMPAAGTVVKRGEPLFTLHQGTRTLRIPAPLSGTVATVNAKLAEHAQDLREDPYIRGWLAVLEPTNLSNELSMLKVADDAAAWLKREISRFRNFIKEHLIPAAPGELAPVGVTLLDGGLPPMGVLEQSDSDTWVAFEKEFLTSPK